MARALFGHVDMAQEPALAYEVARLRRRVSELETELSALRAEHAEVLDLELHEMAQQHRLDGVAEPALA